MGKIASGALFGALVLSGCCTQQATLQPIDTSAISSVQAEIKRQVGVYMAASKNRPTMVTIGDKQVAVNTLSDDQFACGTGAVDFRISTVKAELTTTVDTTTDMKAGLSIPMSSITFGPSVEHKTDRSNTQTLDYNLWPLRGDLQNQDIYRQSTSDADLRGAPIAQAILDLRDAMILVALKMDYQAKVPTQRPPQPCFTGFDPAKPASDAGNTFKLALSITPSDNIGGVSIGVSVLTLSASGESKATTGNTLTVSFVQSDLDKLQYLRDAIDTECKYPNGASQKCKDAKTAFDIELMKGRGVAFH